MTEIILNKNWSCKKIGDKANDTIRCVRRITGVTIFLKGNGKNLIISPECKKLGGITWEC